MHELCAQAEQQRASSQIASQETRDLGTQFEAMVTAISDARAQLKAGSDALKPMSCPGVTLRVSLAMHYTWIGELIAAAQAGRPVNVELADYHACHFGKWYYGPAQTYFGGNAGFAATEDVHKRVHVTGQALVDALRAGDTARSRTLATELEALIGEITQQLEALMRLIP